jgi:DNA-binding IclR family transcriptional regulator
MRTTERYDDDGASVQSVERAFALLRVIAFEPNPCSAPELAKRAAMSKPAVYRLLRAMERANVVVRHAASGRYSVGIAMREFAERDGWFLPLRRAALPEMHRLRSIVGETVVLFAPMNALETICLETLTSEQSIRMEDRVGARFPIGRGAAGMVLLADLAKREGHDAVTSLLSGCDPSELPAGGISTILDRLATETDVRISMLGERIPGGAAIAAAIRVTPESPVIAVIAACGPADRFTSIAIEQWTAHVVDAARRVATRLA